MEATLTVVNIEKQYVQADMEEQLSVTVEIEFREGTDVERIVRVLGFPKDADQGVIKGELTRYKDNLLAERLNQAGQLERDKADKKADATIVALQGETL